MKIGSDSYVVDMGHDWSEQGRNATNEWENWAEDGERRGRGGMDG